MDPEGIVEQVLKTWSVHNEINLMLLDAISSAGLKARPAGSKGRSVAKQIEHMANVRLGWLSYHTTGKRPGRAKSRSQETPTRAQLRKALRESGSGVGEFLDKALRQDLKTRSFKGQAIRWMGYLIAHESHHRGQILLTLKQEGLRVPEKVSLYGLWGTWIWGK